MKHKFIIKNKGGVAAEENSDYLYLLNGHDIGDILSSVTIRIDAGKVCPRATLALIVPVEVNADFDVSFLEARPPADS